jgi:hypothetical protein
MPSPTWEDEKYCGRSEEFLRVERDTERVTMSSSTDNQSLPEGPATPRHGRRVVRIVLATALTGGLAAGVFTIADVAASGSASKAPSDQSKSLVAATSKPSAKTPAPHARSGWVSGRGFARPGGVSVGGIGGTGVIGGIGGLLSGKATALGSDTITIATANGSQVIHTNASTQYYTMLTKGTSKIVSVGAKVAIDLARSISPPESPPSSGAQTSAGAPVSTTVSKTPVASAVVVIEPWAVGSVVSATSSKIVVKDLGGLEQDVDVNGSTSYSEAGTSVGASSVTAGEQVFAYGAVASDPTQLQASDVVVVGPSESGIVTAVSGTSITLRTARATETVTTDAGTIFRNGNTSSSLSRVTKGDLLRAIGTSTSKDTFAASAVTFIAPPTVTRGGSTGSGSTGPARVGTRGPGASGFGASGGQLGGFSSFQGSAGSVIESLIGSALGS